MKKAIIISGPTASGKSSLALQAADYSDIAIINADALQIYRGLPILSSQPTTQDIKIAPHFLYSHFLPEESCSVGLWLQLVKSALEEAWWQNKIPLIVGGSGMYISKLLDGIAEIPAIDGSIKEEAIELYKNLSHEEFVQNLILLSAEKNSEEVGAEILEKNNKKLENLDKQRLIRSYEVLKQTGKTIFWWQKQPTKKIFDSQIFTHINLNIPREQLYKNCNSRFEIMLKNGAIEEVEALINEGFNDNSQISKTLGFAEIKDFLQQKITYEKALETAAQKTRNYAKRQLTWFRHQFVEKNIFDDVKLASEFLKDSVKKININQNEVH